MYTHTHITHTCRFYQSFEIIGQNLSTTIPI